MAKERFSRQEALYFGWDVLKANIGFIFLALFTAFLVQLAPALLASSLKDELSVSSVLARLLYHVAGIFISMGFIRISLNFCDGKKSVLADFIKPYSLFFSFLFGSIFYGLIVCGGILLLIVPGIIWGIQFQFFSYLIIDRKAGPVEALKKSSQITRGAKFDLFIFNMLILGVNLLGFLALGVGMLVTIPVTMLATAFVYRKLLVLQETPPCEVLPI